MSQKNSEKSAEESKQSDENKEKKLHQTISDLTDTLQRLQADFENYKKRVDKEKAQVAIMARAAVLQQLLPIIDAFEIASKSSEGVQLKKGIMLIQSELAKAMSTLDMKPIAAVGLKCDPHKHEVLMQEAREDCEEDIVTEELQKGYIVGNMIVRSSKVKVAKKIKKDEKANENKNAKDTQEHASG